MFTFHTSHMITKSRPSSVKEVIHATSVMRCRAIWDVGKASLKEDEKNHYYKR